MSEVAIQSGNANNGVLRVRREHPGYWLTITDDLGAEELWLSDEQVSPLVAYFGRVVVEYFRERHQTLTAREIEGALAEIGSGNEASPEHADSTRRSEAP